MFGNGFLWSNVVFEKEVISQSNIKQTQAWSLLFVIIWKRTNCASGYFFLSLFSCNFNDQLTPNVLKLYYFMHKSGHRVVSSAFKKIEAIGKVFMNYTPKRTVCCQTQFCQVQKQLLIVTTPTQKVVATITSFDNFCSGTKLKASLTFWSLVEKYLCKK